MNEKLIYERLRQMGQGQDLEVLRNFSQALWNVVKYNEEQLSELSEKINREVKDPAERMYVYGSVADQKEAMLVNHVLFPMEDGEEEALRVFLPWERERITALCSEKKRVILETEEETKEETVWFQPVKRYFLMEEELEREFYQNACFYSNWNLPYLYKFLEMVREGEEEPLKGPANRIWIEGEKEPVKTGMVPYWNIKKIELACTIFPVPAKDESYYEHILEMPDPEDGYLVSGESEIYEVLRRERYLVVRTKVEEARKWTVYQIITPKNKEISIPHLPLTTNQRRTEHTDRQAEHAARLPRTRKEIFRILRSYQISEGITAKDLAVLDEIPDGCITESVLKSHTLETFEYKEKKKWILIQFDTEKPDYITTEQIGFLLRELKSFFPEYEFAGKQL